MRKAETALAEANQAVERQQAKQQAMLNSSCVGEPTEFQQRIATAQATASDAQARLESAQMRQEQTIWILVGKPFSVVKVLTKRFMEIGDCR